MNKRVKKYEQLIQDKIRLMADDIFNTINAEESKNGNHDLFDDIDDVLFQMAPIAINCFLQDKELADTRLRFDCREAMEKMILENTISEVVKKREELKSEYKILTK